MSDSIKVLAIDDENYILKVFDVCLRPPEYKLTTCNGPDNAIAKLKEDAFDIILLDVVMPKIDGFELHSMIRAINPDIPIIMLTARIDDINGIMLKKISADRNTYYQSKNFTKAVLTSKINQIVSDLNQKREKDAYFAEMTRDLAIAGEIQRFLFPRWCSFNNGQKISYYNRSYQNITGDMFNVSQLTEGVSLVVISDFSGHGIPAALFMSALRLEVEIILRKTPPADVTPELVLNRLQSFMRDISSDRYMTAIVCIVDFNRLKITFQSAGHPDFLIYSPSKDTVERPDYTGNGAIPLGMLSDNIYNKADNVEIDLQPDSIIMLFSDGVTEINNDEGQPVGSTLLGELLKSFASSGLEAATVFKIMETIFKLGYTSIKDDISIAAIAQYKSSPNSREFLIRPILDEADDCAQNIAQEVMQHTSNEELASKCEIVASEFLNNIIVHGLGNPNSGRPMILVNLKFEENELTMSYYDKGKEWNSQTVKDDKAYSDKLNKKSADFGRGMSMIRQITSSILHNRYADILNETIISIKY